MSGLRLKEADSLKYLGATLSKDGSSVKDSPFWTIYCNSLFVDLLDRLLDRHQSTQNDVASV